MPGGQPSLLGRGRTGLSGASTGPPTPDFRILITCEHGGNRVPEPWEPLFSGRDELLASHRGWDPGALPLARYLVRLTRARLRYSTTTRLLVDPNRSPGHGTLFSELTRDLPEEDRRDITSRHHRRHWNRVQRLLEGWLDEEAVALHLGVHTFTPVLDGVTRTADIGVLFDPNRTGEAEFARIFIDELEGTLPDLRVQPNAPYEGTSDGLTTSLRRMLDDPGYLGIELEVSQAFAAGAEPERHRVARGIGEALAGTLTRCP